MMNDLIKELHKETRKPMFIPEDDSLWPETWKTVEFKEYPRMPSVVLPEPKTLAVRLDKVLQTRSTSRNFDPSASLSTQSLSTFLYWSAGINRNKENPEHSFRFYPSGGARYPLEVYLSLRGNNEIETGIYHYNVKNHTLEKIHNEDGDEEIRGLRNYPWVKDAAAIIFVTAIFERSVRKYRERGYRFVNLETGILFQNFYLVAEALGIGSCGLGAIVDASVEEILDIDEKEESLMIHLSIGPAR